MPIPTFIASLLGTLVGAVIVGLAWLAAVEHQKRVTMADRIAALELELANVGRAKNRLYREALEDVGFAASQAALHVAALRRQMEDELSIVEAILNRKPIK